MFEELEFKRAYQKAYDAVTVDQACVRRLERGEEKRERRSGFTAVRNTAAVFAALCLLLVTALPVMAAKVPAVYEIVAKYAPALADYMLPVKLSSTSQGITMQVEAVNVEDKTAEILVSFSDADDGTDRIRGKVDLYDSYRLQSYDSTSNIGGCSFLEYDAAADKAYFKIDVATLDEFDRAKLTFSVNQILTECSEEERQMLLDDVVRNPAMKEVVLSGRSGKADSELFEQYFGRAQDGFRQSALVMDLKAADADMAEALTVTGTGYADGILRVQICRGNFEAADRHARLWVKNAAAEERFPDLSVSWQEEVEGEKLLFEEAWFLADESGLEELQLYGTFWITAGSVRGDWEVTFRIE